MHTHQKNLLHTNAYTRTNEKPLSKTLQGDK